MKYQTNKKIIKEEDITLYDRKYKRITYEDGEKILKRYDDKIKMWMVVKFKQEGDDAQTIEKIKQVTKNALLGTIHL